MSKKINLNNFKLSAFVALPEFSKFCKKFGYYEVADKMLDNYKSGKVTFNMVELMDPEKELEERYIKSVKDAMHQLYKLNTAYKKETDAHILGYIETFEEQVEVLETISLYMSELAYAAKVN